jgi:hypothetical protein
MRSVNSSCTASFAVTLASTGRSRSSRETTPRARHSTCSCGRLTLPTPVARGGCAFATGMWSTGARGKARCSWRDTWGASGQLYARWLHSYDSHHDGEPTSKTLPLPLRDEDLLTDAPRDRFAAEVAAYRQLQRAALQLPVVMRIRAETPSPSHAEIMLALRRLNRRPDLVRVDANEGRPEDVRFRLGADFLAVELAV